MNLGKREKAKKTQMPNLLPSENQHFPNGTQRFLFYEGDIRSLSWTKKYTVHLVGKSK